MNCQSWKNRFRNLTIFIVCNVCTGLAYAVPQTQEQFDPMGGLLNEAAGIPASVALSSSPEKLDLLKKDPRYKRYLNGGWDFLESDSGAPAGQYCFAFYSKLDGFVRISGPGGEYKGALLTFWGADVPKPKQMKKIKVTLNQTDEPPQMLQALNFKNPKEVYGAITFAVPTIEAAMDGMLDRQSFEIIFEGRTIAKVEWSDGLQARKKLRQCVNSAQ